MTVKSLREMKDDVEKTGIVVSNWVTKLSDLIGYKGMVTAMGLMIIGYVISAGLYGAGVGLEGFGVTSNSTVLPYYKLITNKATYDTAGLAKPLGTDDDFVVRTDYADGAVPVYVESRTFGLVLTLALVYATTLGALFWKGEDKLAPSAAKVVYTVSLILVWSFVQTDIMFYLGNSDKIASWLATGVVLAQAGLYHASENDGSLEAKNAVLNAELAELFGLKHSIVLLALAVGAYLISMALGVAVIMPLHYAGGISAIPERLQGLVVTYIFSQVMDFFRFAVIILGRSANPRMEVFKSTAKFMSSNLVAAIYHAGVLFPLVVVYAFQVGGLVYQAGLL